MAKRNQPDTKAALATQQVVTDNTEKKSERPLTFVVVRDDSRVSDREYSIANDPFAIGERNFWKRVATNHSHGERVMIVQYDARMHRVW